MNDTTTSLKQKLTNIARAIRVKQGYEADDSTNHGLVLDDFATAIEELDAGGSTPVVHPTQTTKVRFDKDKVDTYGTPVTVQGIPIYKISEDYLPSFSTWVENAPTQCKINNTDYTGSLDFSDSIMTGDNYEGIMGELSTGQTLLIFSVKDEDGAEVDLDGLTATFPSGGTWYAYMSGNTPNQFFINFGEAEEENIIYIDMDDLEDDGLTEIEWDGNEYYPNGDPRPRGQVDWSQYVSLVKVSDDLLSYGEDNTATLNGDTAYFTRSKNYYGYIIDDACLAAFCVTAQNTKIHWGVGFDFLASEVGTYFINISFLGDHDYVSSIEIEGTQRENTVMSLTWNGEAYDFSQIDPNTPTYPFAETYALKEENGEQVIDYETPGPNMLMKISDQFLPTWSGAYFRYEGTGQVNSFKSMFYTFNLVPVTNTNDSLYVVQVSISQEGQLQTIQVPYVSVYKGNEPLEYIDEMDGSGFVFNEPGTYIMNMDGSYFSQVKYDYGGSGPIDSSIETYEVNYNGVPYILDDNDELPTLPAATMVNRQELFYPMANGLDNAYIDTQYFPYYYKVSNELLSTKSTNLIKTTINQPVSTFFTQEDLYERIGHSSSTTFSVEDCFMVVFEEFEANGQTISKGTYINIPEEHQIINLKIINGLNNAPTGYVNEILMENLELDETLGAYKTEDILWLNDDNSFDGLKITYLRDQDDESYVNISSVTDKTTYPEAYFEDGVIPPTCICIRDITKPINMAYVSYTFPETGTYMMSMRGVNLL